MDTKTYSELSVFYNHLMRSIDYNGWADYILDIIDVQNLSGGSLLELAGGNGRIAERIKNNFRSYTLSDLSSEMLKSYPVDSVQSICCDMTSLPFSAQFDIIISTFDSVNYLMSQEKIKKMLREISRCLSPEGILTFDVSLEQNSIKFQKYLNRKGKFNNIKYIQKSYFDERTRIHHNYFEITKPDGTVFSEKHRQKIYRFDEYFKIIETSDLYVDSCYDAFTFNDANENCERAQFILKRRNK